MAALSGSSIVIARFLDLPCTYTALWGFFALPDPRGYFRTPSLKAAIHSNRISITALLPYRSQPRESQSTLLHLAVHHRLDVEASWFASGQTLKLAIQMGRLLCT